MRIFSVNLTLLLLVFPLVLGGCSTVPLEDNSLREKAAAGDMQAQYKMGESYRSAYYSSIFGNMPYMEEAARWYELAANRGHAESQCRLSDYYFTFKSDYDTSFFWASKSAIQGIAEAQGQLSMHYAQGWGTEQDMVLAYKWLALAFEGDLPDPIGKIGDLKWLASKGKMTAQQIAEGRRLADGHTAIHGRSRPIQTVD